MEMLAFSANAAISAAKFNYCWCRAAITTEVVEGDQWCAETGSQRFSNSLFQHNFRQVMAVVVVCDCVTIVDTISPSLCRQRGSRSWR